MVDAIMDPQPDIDLSENPFFAAAQRGLERTIEEHTVYVNQ